MPCCAVCDYDLSKCPPELRLYYKDGTLIGCMSISVSRAPRTSASTTCRGAADGQQVSDYSGSAQLAHPLPQDSMLLQREHCEG